MNVKKAKIVLGLMVAILGVLWCAGVFADAAFRDDFSNGWAESSAPAKTDFVPPSGGAKAVLGFKPGFSTQGDVGISKTFYGVNADKFRFLRFKVDACIFDPDYGTAQRNPRGYKVAVTLLNQSGKIVNVIGAPSFSGNYPLHNRSIGIMEADMFSAAKSYGAVWEGLQDITITIYATAVAEAANRDATQITMDYIELSDSSSELIFDNMTSAANWTCSDNANHLQSDVEAIPGGGLKLTASTALNMGAYRFFNQDLNKYPYFKFKVSSIGDGIDLIRLTRISGGWTNIAKSFTPAKVGGVNTISGNNIVTVRLDGGAMTADQEGKLAANLTASSAGYTSWDMQIMCRRLNTASVADGSIVIDWILFSDNDSEEDLNGNGIPDADEDKIILHSPRLEQKSSGAVLPNIGNTLNKSADEFNAYITIDSFDTAGISDPAIVMAFYEKKTDGLELKDISVLASPVIPAFGGQRTYGGLNIKNAVQNSESGYIVKFFSMKDWNTLRPLADTNITFQTASQ